jgi:hypothetical protein
MRRIAEIDQAVKRNFAVLTEQATQRGASNYWAKLKERLAAEGSQLLTDCQQLKLLAADGKTISQRSPELC